MAYLQDEFDTYIQEKIIKTILEFQRGVSAKAGDETKHEQAPDTPREVDIFMNHILEKLEGCPPHKVRGYA